MARADWSRVRAVVEGALERAGEERARYVTESCGADDALRQQVERLLAQDSLGDGFLQPPDRSAISDLLGEHIQDTLEGTRVGPYAVRRVIGTGGMGTVYEARGGEPERTVALKVMKIDLVDSKSARRFRNESEILAQLDHPAVARVWAVGTEGDGGDEAGEATALVPWFATVSYTHLTLPTIYSV